MSQIGEQGEFFSSVFRQLESLSKLTASSDDLVHYNKTVRAAFIRAGLAILDGYTEVLKTALKKLKEETEASAEPPPGVQKVEVE